MRFETYKDKIYMDKEGENPQMISDLLHEPLEWADVREEEVDPLVEEDVRVDHQDCQGDHWVGHREEIITEIGMILRGMTKAVTSLEK